MQALWNHYDDTASKDFVAQHQLMHVSIVSVMSFLGRLASGISSDMIVKKLGISRCWCATSSALIFMAAQICAIRTENPNFLWAVSALSGLGYGALFGVMATLVVDAFGVQNFAVNWGCMMLAPILSSQVFNVWYGATYDAHSDVQPSGERVCFEGLSCYRNAYWATLASSVLGVLVSLWAIARRPAERPQKDHRIT